MVTHPPYTSLEHAPQQSVYSDRSVDRTVVPLLGGPNKLKLAVFCANVQRGTTQSRVAETLKVTWKDSLAVVQAVDTAGIEAIIPLARWRKTVFETSEDNRVFETFTWAAAVAAVTTRAQIFATVHMPLVHPVMAAKAAATIDQISGGRFGMNVVAGWNTYDFEMFGYKQREHDDRYAVGAEWMQFIERIWSDDQPFDFNGSFYQAKGVVSDPKPVQYPRPAIMSAGSSPAGQAFAQRWADINFAAIKDIKEAPKVIAAAKQAARDAGEDIQIYAGAWIICRDTEQEALDYYDYVIRQHGDKVASEASVAEMLKSSARSIDVFARQTMTERSMGGFFALQLVGTPEQVVGKMKELSDAGVDGLAISWVDYQAGIAQYQEKLLPLMIQAGLRVQ